MNDVSSTLRSDKLFLSSTTIALSIRKIIYKLNVNVMIITFSPKITKTVLYALDMK